MAKKPTPDNIDDIERYLRIAITDDGKVDIRKLANVLYWLVHHDERKASSAARARRPKPPVHFWPSQDAETTACGANKGIPTRLEHEVTCEDCLAIIAGGVGEVRT